MRLQSRGDKNEDEKVRWRTQFDDCFYESHLILCGMRSKANKIKIERNHHTHFLAQTKKKHDDMSAYFVDKSHY